ncbi:MAG: hypothetical protein KDC90_18130, partial [Ignavibacteriae bacterium]|nr:hypothetical protein [Ignavibacteriota bacterium]
DLVHDFPISRIWLNGIEANMAYDYKIRDYVPQGRKLIKGDNGDGTQGVCETHQFYSDRTNSFFYLYSTSNPAFFYKEILIPSQISEGKVQRNTIEVNADYITLKNIEVQGGMYASIALNGADFLIVDNCHIGKYSNWSGILGDSRKKSDKTSDFVTISNSVINSDWNYMYAFYTQETPYGIAIVNGANHWEIYNNIILDWWMNLFIAGKEDACQYINIYNNEIAGPRNTFSKAMQIISGGDWGTPSATYVNFYNNYIHDVVFGIQISSSNNKFFYNVFDNLNLTSINEHAFGAGGWASQMIGDEIHANTSDNYFINNTYHNLLNFANLYTGSNHFNLNNMYVNCGTSRNGIATRVPKDANGTWQNNLLFFDGFTLNSDIIAIQNVNNYTIGEFNALNGQFDKVISGNLQHVGTLSALINNDFSLPNGSPALNAGVDITSYVPEGFTDRHGNLVNRKSPNIGAFASSSSTSESNPLTPSSSNIEILSPNGGESWVANSSHELKWISSSNISQVHIFYSTDNGENWDQISSVENKGSFSWLIPEINSANCLIRVKDADDFSVFDKSDKPFTITANESSSSSDKVLKIFLEATFNNDKMNTELSKTFEIPKEQPYNSSPWSVINTSK